MGTNTLVDKAGTDVVTPSFWNDIHTAISGTFVGRDATTKAPTDTENLGSPTFQWNQLYAKEIILQGESITAAAASLGTNFVKSGKTRTTSNQMQFLTPAGAGNGASVTLEAATTSLFIDVDGTQREVTSDIVISSLTTAPSANNTALINDADIADQALTRIWGEQLSRKLSLTIDAAGTEITDRIGEFHAFELNNGVDTEIFFARIVSATELDQISRGFFYDSSLNPVNRITFADNDTITLLTTNWIFMNVDGTTTDFTSNPPVWGPTEPTSPATGDFWFDSANDTWKEYNGTSFQVANEIFIGFAVCDNTDCLYARCVDARKAWDSLANIIPGIGSASTIKTLNTNSSVSVEGKEIRFNYSSPEWDMATDLATSVDMYNATEQADTEYFFYISDSGEFKISDIHPIFISEKRGFYHPHNTWRAVARYTNNGTSALDRGVPFPGFAGDKGPQLEYIAIRTNGGNYLANADTQITFSLLPVSSNETYHSFGESILADISGDIVNFGESGSYLFSYRAHVTTAPAGNALPSIKVKKDGTDYLISPELPVVATGGSFEVQWLFDIDETAPDYTFFVSQTASGRDFTVGPSPLILRKVQEREAFGFTDPSLIL